MGFALDIPSSLESEDKPLVIDEAGRTNVYHVSSAAVRAILGLHFPSGQIIDPTGSVGAFYRNVEGREIVRGDIRPEVNPDYLGDFRSIPYPESSFEVGFFDPPYKRGRRDEDFYSERYGKAPNNENAATKLYFEGLPELFRVCRSGVIAKAQDASDGHAFHDRRTTLANFVRERYGLRVHDICYVRPNSKLPAKIPNGRPRLFRQGLSYFLIWKFVKVDGDKFKQVRF